MRFKELDDVLRLIEKKKDAIAKERDDLREIFNEVAYLLDRFDAGIEGLESGKREIENGIDSISEVV